MSYSFMVKAATVEALLAEASAKFDEVQASQPDHEADRAQALASVEAFAAALGDAPEGKLIQLHVSGSNYSEDWKLIAVSFSVNGGLVDDDTIRETD